MATSINEHSFTPESYNRLYKQSINRPRLFWSQQEQNSLSPIINITYNCLDRHLLSGGGDKLALIAVSENGDKVETTYLKLSQQVAQLGNYLLSRGVKKGDTVTIYMPLVTEQVVAMLACARIGAIHSVVYAGFSSQALRSRIICAKSCFLLTADYTFRRGKAVDLLSASRQALNDLPFSVLSLVLRRNPETVLLQTEADWQQNVGTQSTELAPALVAPTDPLFILYTSGTTGQPKGIIHGTRGYNLYTHLTTKYTFDLQSEDILWCTADPGWISGHSYVVYGPLSNHATCFIYEGVPNYPRPDVWWHLIDQYRITILYTAPTAIRLLMTYGEQIPAQYQLSSLRLLGSVGEPIDPATWNWYSEHIGRSRCPIVDTWWQTETGGHMLTTLPGLPQKPGYTGLPFFGIEPLIVDDQGREVKANVEGNLAIKNSWPGALLGCWHDEARYQEYWHTFAPYFKTGDLAVRDSDGYFRVLGRSDDIIIVSGHNISSAELEAALNDHPAVVESAAVGIPDSVTGQQIVAFVVLLNTSSPSEELSQSLINHIGNTYGKHARPTSIQFTPSLPKTRSGKIMRRILRSQLLNLPLGDTSTLHN